MQTASFEDVLNSIVNQNPAYHRDAYVFLREALDFTQKKLAKLSKKEVGHISGKEFLEGIRECALAAYGPMALTVFEEWGIRNCQDFGQMVFLMVEKNLLKKTENDNLDDFENGYSFEAAFREPFLPAAKRKTAELEPKPVNTEV